MVKLHYTFYIYMYINSKVAKKKSGVKFILHKYKKNLLQHILRHHFKTASSEEAKKKQWKNLT